MHKLTMILVALAISWACALAQVVETAGAAAGSGSARPSSTAGQGAPESKGSAGSAGTMGRQIGTLPRVMATPTPGMVRATQHRRKLAYCKLAVSPEQPCNKRSRHGAKSVHDAHLRPRGYRSSSPIARATPPLLMGHRIRV